MKKANSMSKDSSNLSKSRSRCYFRRSLVNFKNLITICMVHEKVEEVLRLIRNI